MHLHTHTHTHSDLNPVVESLASVFHSHAPPSVRCLLYLAPRWALHLHWPPWSKRLRCVVETHIAKEKRGRVAHRPPTLHAHCTYTNRRWLGLTAAHASGSEEDAKAAGEFQSIAGSATFAMAEWGAARALAVSWLDSLATWLEVTEAWAAGDKATLRMEEVGGLGNGVGMTHANARLHSQSTHRQFIHPARRPERLGAVLRFLLGEEGAGAILEDEATAARCLAGV